MASSEFVGALFAVIAAVVSNFGTNIQKASHLAAEKIPEEERTPYYKRKLWIMGFLCTMSGSVLDFLALGLASQSLVAALGGGMTLITNVLVAAFYNKEKTYWTDVVGVVFIIGGAVTFAVTAEPKPENIDYLSQFTNLYFLVYLGGQSLVIIALLSSITHSHFANIRSEYYHGLLAPVQARVDHLEKQVTGMKTLLKELVALEGQRQAKDSRGSQSSIAELRWDEEDLEPPLPVIEYRKRDKYIYAMCAGSIGALSILFGGVVSSMFREGVEEALQKWFFYLALVLMVATLIGQTHLQNRALELGDATSVFPVFEAFWISFGVISGLVYYNTSGITWDSDLKQVSGILPMLVGIVFLFLHQDTMRPMVEDVEGSLASSFEVLRQTLSAHPESEMIVPLVTEGDNEQYALFDQSSADLSFDRHDECELASRQEKTS